MNRQAFSVEGIDRGEDPKPATVEQRVAHEVHRPALIRPRALRNFLTMNRRPGTLRALAPEIQPSRLENPVHPLVIHVPAFTAKQRMHALVSVPDAALGDLLDPHLQRRILLRQDRFISKRQPRFSQGEHLSLLTHVVRVLQRSG